MSYASDEEACGRPAFVTTANNPVKYRFRLMQFTQATEELQIYKAGATEKAWFSGAGSKSVTHPLAENVIALIVLARRPSADGAAEAPLSPDYAYNSRTPWVGGQQPVQSNQLPPLLRVVMVVIDEKSAQKFCKGSAAPDLGLAKAFGQSGSANPSTQQEQLESLQTMISDLENELNRQGVRYQVFQSDIAIRGTKWSR